MCMEQLTCALILLGLSTGICIGAVFTILIRRPIPPSHNLQKLLFSQRDSLRALRLDFNNFRDNHERELMTILRETLRTSPRSVDLNDEPSVS